MTFVVLTYTEPVNVFGNEGLSSDLVVPCLQDSAERDFFYEMFVVLGGHLNSNDVYCFQGMYVYLHALF